MRQDIPRTPEPCPRSWARVGLELSPWGFAAQMRELRRGLVWGPGQNACGPRDPQHCRRLDTGLLAWQGVESTSRREPTKTGAEDAWRQGPASPSTHTRYCGAFGTQQVDTVGWPVQEQMTLQPGRRGCGPQEQTSASRDTWRHRKVLSRKLMWPHCLLFCAYLILLICF